MSKATKRSAAAKVLVLATVTSLAGGCKIDRMKLPGGDGAAQTPCTEHADLLVAFSGQGNGSAALGEPDGDSVAVVAGDVLTVGFVGLGGVVDNVDAIDIIVHGALDADATANAYVSNDGESFEYAGTLRGVADAPDGGTDGLEIDIWMARLSVAVYLRIIGEMGGLSIDAFESLSICPP